MFYLKSLKLNNFRCYKEYYQEFTPKINIIIGDNAVGKTSIIEGIYVLGVTKSHKAAIDNEMIKHNEEFSLIKGEFKGDKTDVVTLSLTEKGKQIIKNEKKIKHLSEYLGFYYSVLFCPEDVEIIKGAPAIKRRFLDINIGQLNQTYLNNLIDYRKILKDRNKLLKDFQERDDFNKELLDIYTKQLISKAKDIILTRQEFIKKLNVYFKKQVSLISDGKEDAYIKYMPNTTIENIEKDYKEKEKVDFITKTTNVGPHRDDFIVYFNEHESIYASQGQQKTFALALKLALIDILKEKSNKIIVILDDVFGELDIIRQKEIIKLLEIDYQIFITTTSIDHLNSDVLRNSNIIRINKEGEYNGRSL